MPDPERLLRRVATAALDPSASAPPSTAVAPGRTTRVVSPGVDAVTPSAISRVKACAGQELDDGHHYVYRVTDDGAFEVTDAPDDRAIGRVITPDGAYKASWIVLARLLKEGRGRAPAAPATAPAETGEPSAATAMDRNLAEAKQLADATSVPHTYDATGDKAPADDVKGWDRRLAIIAGRTAKLKTIVCSEFTTLTMQKTGVDLNQRYLDPVEHLPIAYYNAKGTLVFADLYQVTVNQQDTLEALLAVARGAAKKIEADSPESRAFQRTLGIPGPYWYVATRSATPELAAGDAVGAAATAQALGGVAVSARDRRPGDLQQRVAAKHGKLAPEEGGHSSQVWAVRGTGVAYYGGPGSPTLVPAPRGDIPPGWYRVGGEANGVFWEVGPETDPAMVASLDVGYVQLIDANRYVADATSVKAMKAADAAYDPTAASSTLTATGRLPTSKWFDWKPATPELAGTIMADGVHALE